jgi:hypothetical protein
MEPGPPPIANIADPFWDLLARLDDGPRLGLIHRLAVGFYDGWRPSRREIEQLVDLELGQISREEYLGEGRRLTLVPAEESAVAGEPTTAGPAQSRASAEPKPDDAAKRESRPTLTFTVDCGTLAPEHRFIATGLSNDGWTIRNGKQYRLASLHYKLVPTRQPAAVKRPTPPILFTAAMVCVPEVAAPFADGDGTQRWHSVRPNSIAGTRGMWPLAKGVKRINFLITGQAPVGAEPMGGPAGMLRVDLTRRRSSWLRLGSANDRNEGAVAH